MHRRNATSYIHCLVYATLKLGSKRAPPKIISTRNFDAAIFKTDIERIPFHILEIFHHKDNEGIVIVFSITKTMPSGDGNNRLKIYAMLTLRLRM